ncbi:MAG: methionyl-tRNA formyltransferase [Massiliimalia sp.]|jgi:methionyl-tRNA formyltransferase
MRIVFMGTPEFAVPCLQALLDSGEQVVGVYTQPDKPKGRGHKVLPPPVKELAMKYDIPVFQPVSLKKDPAEAEQLKNLAPDLIVVVAYGKILPKSILDIPPLGCVNVHASLLPKYRGAGPIQWSVLNGETKTGVTTMYMAEGLDTGDMILKAETAIGENETADELHDRLSVLGAETLVKTVALLKEGSAPRIPQDDSLSCYAPMLSKEMSQIDFTQPANLVHNKIRGLSSWPCAVTTLMGKRLKVYRSELVNGYHGKPGEILCNKTFVVGCGENTAIRFTEVQFEGSKRMKSEDFLRGKQVQLGTICGERQP